MLNRRRRGSASCWVLAFSTTSYQQLLWTPTHQGPKGPLRRLLYHNLSSNSSNLQLWLLSWLSYMIVQRPLNRPLNLWNGMFDHHQAEITVMQFTGHSLPVHHSEVGPSPCPILSAELTCAISSHNCHWNVSLPSGASLWMLFLTGSKVKIQHLHQELSIFPRVGIIIYRIETHEICIIWVHEEADFSGCFRLSSKDSAWAGIFARIARSSV